MTDYTDRQRQMQTKCRSDQNDDDAQRKGKVFEDDCLSAPAQLQGERNIPEVVAHEDDVRRFHCHVCSRGSHCHADIGGRKRWCIVNAITHHGNRAFLLQQANGIHLIFRQEFISLFIYPGLPSDRSRDPIMVSRQHHKFSNSQAFQFAGNLQGVWAQSVSDCN
jgi:hypothetical protein